MKCAKCGRSVRDENAVIDSRVIREPARFGGLAGSHTETRIYGPTCARNLGILAAKPVREKKIRVSIMHGTRLPKRDTLTPDLFEGMQNE